MDYLDDFVCERQSDEFEEDYWDDHWYEEDWGEPY